MENNRNRKIIISSIVIAVILGMAIEILLRTNGYTPTYPVSMLDMKRQWHEVVREDHSASDILLLGTSRMLTDIDQGVLEDNLGGKVIQMGVGGGFHPFFVLKTVVEETNFNGRVIVEVVPIYCSDEYDYFSKGILHSLSNKISYSELYDSYIYNWLSEQSTLLSPRVSIFSLERIVVYRDSLKFLMLMSSDRQRRVYYNFKSLNLSRAVHNEGYYAGLKVLSPEDWLNYMAAQDKYADMIEARGGEVVYVRFPTSGISHVFEEKVLPKSECWDKFAQYTDSVTIHYKEFEREYVCPDDTHLDWHDASSFTLDLVKRINGN